MSLRKSTASESGQSLQMWEVQTPGKADWEELCSLSVRLFQKWMLDLVLAGTMFVGRTSLDLWSTEARVREG